MHPPIENDEQFEAVYGEQAWDERYRATERNWSGNPNAALVAEVSDLTPGSALDAGSGEGGDAFWLAEQGWQVTGIEFAATALERSAAEAIRRGVQVRWQHVDLTKQAPDEQYDLVSSFYVQLPLERRRRLFAHLAGAVAPGGTLLIVGHDLSDQHTVVPRPDLAEMGWSADEVAATLGAGWQIDVAEARSRPVMHDDHEVDIYDAVMRAHRV